MRFILSICLLSLVAILVPRQAKAQFVFKKIYKPDTNTIMNPGFLNAPGIIETGIPGREIAVTGAVNGQDTSGFALATYLFQANQLGDPVSFDYYDDVSPFALSTPRSFALCYDDLGSYYLATGSNDNQVVAQIDTSGELKWATDVNHHEFYDIICEGTRVTLLGQDESMIGGHDYSVIQVTDSGLATGINIHGSIDFDIPMGIAKVNGGYIMAGQSVGSGERDVSIIRVDNSLDLEWGHVLGLPGRQLFCMDMALAANGNSFYVAGGVRKDQTHPSDSVFLAKINNSGTPEWMKFYGNDSLTTILCNTIAVDPIEGSVLMGGDFDATGWRSPFVMRVDSAGNFLWAKNYSQPDTSYEESVEAIDISPSGQFFSVSGVHNYIPPSFQIFRNFFILRAEIENGDVGCDTNLLFRERMAPLVNQDVIVTGTPGPPPSIPYAYQRGGGSMEDELICQSSVMISVNDPFAEPFSLSVINPANQEFIIRSELGWGGGQLELFQLQGQQLARLDLDEGWHESRMPAQHLPGGIYFITLTNDQGDRITRKVVLYR